MPYPIGTVLHSLDRGTPPAPSLEATPSLEAPSPERAQAPGLYAAHTSRSFFLRVIRSEVGWERLSVVGLYLVGGLLALIGLLVGGCGSTEKRPESPHLKEGERAIVEERFSSGRTHVARHVRVSNNQSVVARLYYTEGGTLYRRDSVQTGVTEVYQDLYPAVQEDAIWSYLSGLWRSQERDVRQVPVEGGATGRLEAIEERLYRGDTLVVRQWAEVTLPGGEVVAQEDYRMGVKMELRSPGVIGPTERLYESKNGSRREYPPGDSMRVIPDDLMGAVADTIEMVHPDRFIVYTSEEEAGYRVYERVKD